MISIIQSSTLTESVLISQKATKHIHQAWTCIQLKRMPTTHQRHCRNRSEWLRFHAAFQLFYRWHHSIYLVHSVFQVQIQIILSECWFRCNDVMFDSLEMPHRWRHLSGQGCENALSTFAERNVQSSVLWYAFSLSWQTHMFRYNVSASTVLRRVSNVGTWPALRRVTERQTKVDHLALRPTCCLFNALIRFTSKWTWHSDTKEFHSRHVRSSPYCINMPLMFHSDTGL